MKFISFKEPRSHNYNLANQWDIYCSINVIQQGIGRLLTWSIDSVKYKPVFKIISEKYSVLPNV